MTAIASLRRAVEHRQQTNLEQDPALPLDHGRVWLSTAEAIEILAEIDRLTGWQGVDPKNVERWVEEKGYHAIYQGGTGAFVQLADDNGDPGILFERESLSDACAIADRLMDEVPGPDDVGAEECERLTTEWLRANDPENGELGDEVNRRKEEGT